MIRLTLADVGRWIESLVSPAPQVQFGVDQARDEQEQRDVDEMAAFFNLDPAAADAAGTGPGAPATPSPAPGHPDPHGQAAHAQMLIFQHEPKWHGALYRYECSGCDWVGPNGAQYTRHLADLVTDMLTADVRMSAATNKFRK